MARLDAKDREIDELLQQASGLVDDLRKVIHEATEKLHGSAGGGNL